MMSATSGNSSGKKSVSLSSKESTSALHQILSPDGYYSYLGIARPSNDSSGGAGDIDEEVVKRNYRRMSLKHHPDRRGGDAETFRVLNRAKKVLTSPKLRKQYDLLGLDLHDEEEESNNNDDAGKSVEEEGSTEDSSSPDTVMSQIASATLASILQMTVRTVLVTIGITFISRYKMTLVPLVLFLLYVAYGVKITVGSKLLELAAPMGLALGAIIMHAGRATIASESDGSASTVTTSTWLFFFGETLTIYMFFQTSLTQPASGPSLAIFGIFVAISSIAAFILQGRFWRYVTIIVCEAGLALLTVLIFPVLEMLLEEIINEKLKKVGEKVRAHGKRMDMEITKAHQNGNQVA